jgi:hypothetical protein
MTPTGPREAAPGVLSLAGWLLAVAGAGVASSLRATLACIAKDGAARYPSSLVRPSAGKKGNASENGLDAPSVINANAGELGWAVGALVAEKSSLGRGAALPNYDGCRFLPKG